MTAFDSLVLMLNAQIDNPEVSIEKKHHCDDARLKKLTPLLVNHPYIKSISFQNTTITEFGLEELLSEIAKKGKITGLRFYKNNSCFGPMGMSSLNQFVANYLYLEELALIEQIEESSLRGFVDNLGQLTGLKHLTLSTPISETVLKAILEQVESKPLCFEFAVASILPPSENSQALINQINLLTTKNREAKERAAQSKKASEQDSAAHHAFQQDTIPKNVTQKKNLHRTPREQALAKRAEREAEESQAYFLDQQKSEVSTDAIELEALPEEANQKASTSTRTPAPKPRDPQLSQDAEAISYPSSDSPVVLNIKPIEISEEKVAYYRERYQAISAQCPTVYEALVAVMKDYLEFTPNAPCDFFRKIRRRITTNAEQLLKELDELCHAPESSRKNEAIQSYLSRHLLEARMGTHECLVITLDFLRNLNEDRDAFVSSLQPGEIQLSQDLDDDLEEHTMGAS